MSQETLGKTQAEKIQAIKELTAPEIHKILLPILTPEKPLLSDDVSLIQTHAAVLMHENGMLTVEEAIISAADARFNAREDIAGDRTAIVGSDGSVINVVPLAESRKALLDAAEEARGA